ncbi:hypothetical protein B0H13DRAFT_2076778 [Mycena leptocephala]|nr:hypothetical protein B0H13DRAFT_2076778 [Mycena leptocephala]
MIFDFLLDELFCLSILCRRLHFLALPIFLDRRSITNPCEITVVDMGAIVSPDIVLRALTVALFVPSVKNLVCTFPSSYVYRHLDSIWRVTRLVRRLTTVENLSLKFAPGSYTVGNLTQEENYSESRVWQACHSALCDLLNVVNNKSCTSLSILGSPVPAASRETPLPSPPAGTRMGSVTTLSLDVDRSSSSSPWMLMALKNTPIASLKLFITTDTKLENVADFPATLTALSLAGEFASRSEVLTYLGKHPLLKTLTLANGVSKHIPVTSSLDARSPLHLANLVELTTPVSYLSHFLQTCDSLPSLERLRIFVDDLTRMGWDLTALVERMRECRPSKLLPAITVEITGRLEVDSLTDSIRFITFMGGKWTHAARHIIGLAVDSDLDWFRSEPRSVDPDVARILLNWFRLFTGLRTIFIQGLVEDEMFAESIASALPHVQTIQFNQCTVFER